MTLVAAVREEENADLLIQSGASSVITSSDAAGRLLGLATESPRAVAIVEDLIAVGTGLDLMEREVTSGGGRAGPRSRSASRSSPSSATARPSPTTTTSAATLQAGDRIVYVGSNGGEHGVVPAHQ